MKICVFGGYDSNYSRSKIIIHGLKLNNIHISECKAESYIGFKPSINYFKNLLINYKNLIKNYEFKDFDFIFVAYPPSLERYIFLAKILSINKPIMYDPFISLYNTFVYDRKLYKPNSIQANFLYFYEKQSYKLSNILLSDTKSHGLFYKKLYQLKNINLKTLYLGSDNRIFYPRNSADRNTQFTVGFYGRYILLQGVEYIFDAAKILENYKEIEFEIVGGKKGNEYYEKMMKYFKKKELKNVSLVPEVSLEELPNFISRSDVQLGIFGGTIKSKIVIPNKVFTAIAMRKPVITANTVAVKEVFTNQENIFLCDAMDGKSLAKSILTLYFDKKMRNNIATNAFKLYSRKFTPKQLGLNLINILNSSMI